MAFPDLPYHSSPFTHLCFLVSEALGGPRHERAARPASPATGGTARGASWLDRLDQWAWRQTQKDSEVYLAESTDLADVERRLRALDRVGLRRWY
jgi:hypothetical protein